MKDKTIWDNKNAPDFTAVKNKQAFHCWLTEEILGECWHEWIEHNLGSKCFKCGIKSYPIAIVKNRTFTTWEDYGAVMTAMKKTTVRGYVIFDILEVGRLYNRDIKAVFSDVTWFFATLQEWWEKGERD